MKTLISAIFECYIPQHFSEIPEAVLQVLSDAADLDCLADGESA
jgi:hypothetical protein